MKSTIADSTLIKRREATEHKAMLSMERNWSIKPNATPVWRTFPPLPQFGIRGNYVLIYKMIIKLLKLLAQKDCILRVLSTQDHIFNYVAEDLKNFFRI